MPVQTTNFTAPWSLSCTTQNHSRPDLPTKIPAQVPGTVHIDLMNAELISDPYIDLNEIRQDWVGWQDWRYTHAFEADKKSATRHDLVFDGLDTFADITLNDTPIAQTANMHRTYRLNVDHSLTQGENTLTVDFRSPRAVGLELEKQFAPRPNNYPGQANLMRKMACDFGWDWGPSMATSGIWKGARLESWSKARLSHVRPHVTLDGANGSVTINITIERDGLSDDPINVSAATAGITANVTIEPGQTEAVLALKIPAPQIWWPHGLGNQPLYDLDITLTDTANSTLDNWHKKIGFRSIRLDTTPDEIGSAFTFVINDVPIFVMGANWIPDDCFLPRVTPERLQHRITQAKGANINMLRIWGGGVYESDEFYAACDAAGMLVWQDFLFACAAYPEEGNLPAEIEAEARDNVERLMSHASLVLWNGNNENIWGYFDWGWQKPLDGNSWGQGYYLDLLPKIVAETDPTTPYFAGSPYSGTMDLHPNDPNHGCNHEWDVWNETGYEEYTNYVPRFMSEFGWQAPPTWSTLTRSVHDDPLTPTSPGVWHHQKATIGNDKLLRGLKGHLPEPENTDDWHFATQLNQARAIAFGIEHLRSHRPQCMGSIVWQLNDCWPVTSWAAIDGYGKLKPLWYALKKVYASHLLTIQPRTDDAGEPNLAVIAVNERTLFWRSPVSLKRMHLDGTVLAEFDCWRLGADRMTTATLAIPANIATPENPREEFIIATMQDCTAFWFFNEDIELDLPAPKAEFSVHQQGDIWQVTLTAKTFLRDVCLFVDRIHPDAEVDDMLINILPGQTHTFSIKSPVPITSQAISSAPVFRCANDLVQPKT